MTEVTHYHCDECHKDIGTHLPLTVRFNDIPINFVLCGECLREVGEHGAGSLQVVTDALRAAKENGGR